VTAPARKRRWPKFLAAFAVLLLIGAWWVNRQLEPNRLTALVLDRAGTALGLELTIEGTPEYALRPEPRLVLPGLTARRPGAAAPLLTAKRAEVSLPWSTLTGDGSLVITRIELDAPVLDLEALSDWQATRPEAPFELPTLTRGLAVNEGRVIGNGWTLEAMALDLPGLTPGQPARAVASGRFEQPGTRLDFDADLDLATAGLASGMSLRMRGRLENADLDVPYLLELDGDFDAGREPMTLAITRLSLDSEGVVPDLSATGKLSFGDTLALDLAGELATWPAAWPTLPAPLAESTSPLAYTLVYEGPTDLSADSRLTLERDDTTAATTLALPELTAWLDDPEAAPLPPLEATLSTPSVVMGGVTLEGVRISIEEDDAETEAKGQAGEPPASDGTP
jgi:hypothetical protein